MSCGTDDSSPVVSVVMIAYNMEKYISTAIEGVVSQRTDFPFELIIMDDCSSDSTPEVIKAWKRKYPDVIRNVRNVENLGLQRNYLEGFSLCRGKYMAICDADDYWFCKTKLARQVTYMDQNPECAISFHRMVNYYEASGEKSLSNGGQRVDTGLADLSKSNFITNSSVMYRRNNIDLSNLPQWISLDRSPDYALHMLYARTGTIHYLSRPMGVYRKTTGSSWSMTGCFEKLRMSLTVRMSLLNEFSECEEAVEGLKASSSNIIRAMKAYAKTAEEKEYLTKMASRLDVDLQTPIPIVGNQGRSILSKIRRAVSKFMPLPKP